MKMEQVSFLEWQEHYGSEAARVDAYVGKHFGGKRGRGAEGKRAVLLAVEKRGLGAGFMSEQVVNLISVKETVKRFVDECISPAQTVHTNAFRSMNVISKTQFQESRVTPGKKAGKWLPWVHIVIGNLKTFLNGTFHDVSGGYLQEYLNEFCYRFNLRFWENELPYRLLNVCLIHKPIRIADFR